MPADHPCHFAAEPLDRACEARINPDFIAARLSDPQTVLVALYRGDPLVRDGRAAMLSIAARREFGDAPLVFLGLGGGRAHFAVDASAAASAEAAPFAEIGAYAPIREAAGAIDEGDLAIIGHARWLLGWHARHRHCAVCGALTEIGEAGAKRQCPECKAEHFPRSDPVAIVLATHDGACLLGRSPHYPGKRFSALAGYVEAAETPEACAARELREEAGVRLTDVRYQFSQPWPFPSSLMMGFIADAADRALTLDAKEIIEAHWVARTKIKALLRGEGDDILLPPRFTIARRLIEKWADDPAV
ncbi:MAG: NAD(+) diphosphatase [Amphiplicatus sp.]